MPKMTSNTTPCRIVVLPVLRERMITNKDNRKSTVDPAPIPRDRGRLVYNETKETVGMVSPILARAEPRERLRLRCN
jgi:hypothetical protein